LIIIIFNFDYLKFDCKLFQLLFRVFGKNDAAARRGENRQPPSPGAATRFRSGHYRAGNDRLVLRGRKANIRLAAVRPRQCRSPAGAFGFASLHIPLESSVSNRSSLNLAILSASPLRAFSCSSRQLLFFFCVAVKVDFAFRRKAAAMADNVALNCSSDLTKSAPLAASRNAL
jgi:hypothetical protein